MWRIQPDRRKSPKKKILKEECDKVPAGPAPPADPVIPNIGTSTNKFRIFCGLPECKTATYHDSRRQAFIDRHNLHNSLHHHLILHILPTHALHNHLRISAAISHDIARTHIFRCTKGTCTFTALSIKSGIAMR